MPTMLTMTQTGMSVQQTTAAAVTRPPAPTAGVVSSVPVELDLSATDSSVAVSHLQHLLLLYYIIMYIILCFYHNGTTKNLL